MNLIISILVALLGFTSNKSSVYDHPFYVSIAELNIEDDTLQISIRVFTDDLEYALNERADEKIFLNSPAPSQQNFVHIRDYLDQRFVISDAAKAMRINWLGHEFEDDVCWIYGEVALNERQRMIFIKNAILTEIYDGQQNLIHFNLPEGIESKLASSRAPEVRFSIN